MKTIQEIRRNNIRKLAQRFGSIGSFAHEIERTSSYASQLVSTVNPCTIGNSIARHIEKCFNLSKGHLDQDHDRQQVDLPALNMVIAKLEAALVRRKMQIKANEKAELIGLFYARATGDDPLTSRQITRLINQHIDN